MRYMESCIFEWKFQGRVRIQSQRRNIKHRWASFRMGACGAADPPAPLTLANTVYK